MCHAKCASAMFSVAWACETVHLAWNHLRFSGVKSSTNNQRIIINAMTYRNAEFDTINKSPDDANIIIWFPSTNLCLS